MNWIEITAGANSKRYEILSESLTAMGAENTFKVETIDPAVFDETLARLMEKTDIIRIGKSLGQLVLHGNKAHSLNIERVGAADILYRNQGQWWVRSALQYGIHKTLSNYSKNVNVNYRALVAGAGASGNTAIAVLVQIGFKQIYILDASQEKADQLRSKLSVHFFGVEFQVISQEELLKIVGHCSLVINTTPNVPGNVVLEDLCYFNYLLPEGLVVEMNIDNHNSPIISEAKGMEIEVVDGCYLAARTDAVWTQWMWNVQIDVEDYYLKLKQAYGALESSAD